MQLSQTNSGNCAKKVGIGAEWESLGVFKTEAEARACSESHNQAYEALVSYNERLMASRGTKITSKRRESKLARVREIAAYARLAEQFSVPTGTACYMAVIPKKQRQVMVHADAAECLAAGKTPGPFNL